jgi:hypothetical protein
MLPNDSRNSGAGACDHMCWLWVCALPLCSMCMDRCMERWYTSPLALITAWRSGKLFQIVALICCRELMLTPSAGLQSALQSCKRSGQAKLG